MKLNVLYLFFYMVLVVGLISCDNSKKVLDSSNNESCTPETSQTVNNESVGQNETESNSETDLQKSDTLKMSIDFPLISQNAEVVALEVEGIYDTFDRGNHASEYDPWSLEKTKPFNNAYAARSAVISFFGKSSNCEYQESQLDMFRNFPSDSYKGKTTDGDSVKFELHPDSGEIIEYRNYSIDSGSVSVEEAKETADKIAGAYIDIRDFEFSVDSNDIIHNFRYVKKIGEFTTAEFIKIGITTDGKLTYFYQNMIGTFDLDYEEEAVVISRLEQLSLYKSKDVLEEKIESIYPDYSKYEVDDATATVLEDGSIAMVYNVDIEYIIETSGENGETGEFYSGSRVLIVLK